MLTKGSVDLDGQVNEVHAAISN